MATIEKPVLPIDHAARARTLDTQQSFLVQAPAGSGKTELLTRRLLKLLAQVNEPEEILAITFTLAATAEMRARVLDALHKAACGDEEDPQIEALAQAALKNGKDREWNLLQQPQRLNIQTIDAVCLAIAHETPLLSRLGGTLAPTDKPQALYTLAARRTLARLGLDAELSAALRALLQLRSASLSDCQKLIADMLDKRDQWGRELPLGQTALDWRLVREALEAPLHRLHRQALEKAQSLFTRHPGLAEELVAVLDYACGNVDAASELQLLKDIAQIDQLKTHAHWMCLCNFLLKKDGAFRKRLDQKMGFPPGQAGTMAKQRYAALIDALETEPALLTMLHELRDLPPKRYSEEESQMLRHLLIILRYAVAELTLVFAERGVVDFVQLGLAARQVLSNEEGELAADVAARWRHLLVDEFQDTSRSQYELLTLLVQSWEETDRGTCFLVGDPMQSIYRFRQAEVELFERTRRHGLGEGPGSLPVALLQLHTNFRSHNGLVDRLNVIFEQVFVRRLEDDELGYHVAFAPSTAAGPGKPAVHLWPFFISSKATPEEKQGTADAEARQVVSLVERHWAKVEKAQNAHGEFRIAVLVRARSHLGLIARRLRKAKIPFRAVEIEQLGERQEVQDLTALTRALLHPMDRIAWLSVLRAPWSGLTLRDLHTLCGSDGKEFSAEPVLTLLRERTTLLSEDGRRRASRVHGVMEEALRGKHRQVSLAAWVERTWASLGGDACVDRGGYENARTFFTMLEELGPDAVGLEERIAELCAQPDPDAGECCGVQLMTIHKAKGLGFNVVIVPGLERTTQLDQKPLLHWIEQTRLAGEQEQEEREFVVAPIGRNGEESGIYRWITQQHTRRQDDEAKRLLYVAATRARDELHLLGTATVKVPKHGIQELTAGDKHSLLGIAWEALRADFTRAYAEQVAVQATMPVQTELVFPDPMLTIPLPRLPADWKLPISAPTPANQNKSVEIHGQPRGSPGARALGSAVHGLLEDLAKLPGIHADGVSAAVFEEVAGWRPRALALLRASGLPRTEAEAQSTEVVRVLLAMLRDPAGRWILGARAGAETEISWSAFAGQDSGDVLRTLRGDRIFRAGATPGTVEETHLWVVDYKTVRHGAAGVDEFLAGEKAKYAPQLESYGEMLRKLPANGLPVRLALYFPRLTRLVWW